MEFFYIRARKGDCLLSIARKYGVSIEDIKRENKLFREVCKGDILLIKRTEKAVVYGVDCGLFDNLPSVKESYVSVCKKNGLPYLFYGLPFYT